MGSRESECCNRRSWSLTRMNLMKTLRRVLGVLSICTIALPSFAQSDTIMGFTPKSTTMQHQLEDRFKALITPEGERVFHRYFTSEPHPAGTEQNRKVAEYIAETWRKQGIEDVVIRQYDVLSSLPTEISLE